MASKLQKQGHKWTFRYLDGSGKQRRYTCTGLTHQEAQEERIEFINNARALKDKRRPDDIKWDAFCKKFLEYVSQNKSSPETYQTHLQILERILKPVFVKDVDTAAFNNYICARLANGITKSSINRELNTFRSLFSWAIDIEDYAIKHPLNRKIRPYKLKTVVKERVLSAQEVGKIFDMLPKNKGLKGKSLDLSKEKRDMILTLLHLGLYAGLRLKEAKLLKRKNVLFDNFSIIVEPQKTAHSDPNPKLIPLAQKLEVFLKKIFAAYPKEEYATPNIPQEDRAAHTPNLSHLIKDTLTACGINDAGMHTCRHTFISNLANNANIDSVDIMDYARIKSINILKVYRHITSQAHRKNINQLTY